MTSKNFPKEISKNLSAFLFEIRHIYRGIKKERREVLCVD